MTVINAMRFNPTEAGIVADTQMTFFPRKRNIMDKIIAINDSPYVVALVGGAGSASNVLTTLSDLKEEYGEAQKTFSAFDPKKSDDTEETQAIEEVICSLRCVKGLSRIITNLTIRSRRDNINKLLEKRYGISGDQFLADENINPHLWSEMKDIYTDNDEDIISSNFLVVGSDSRGVHIYTVEEGDLPVYAPKSYVTIGSGSDVSDHVLGCFVEGLKRDERNKLDFVKGMAALIRATNTSIDSNIGVGGSPTISYISSRENVPYIVRLKEQEAHLASEIVRVHDARLMTQKVMYSSLDALLRGGATFNEIEPTAFGNNYKKINRFLRGYK